MHPVGEVHVGVAGRAEHHGIPCSPSAMGVACAVSSPPVRFRFGDLDSPGAYPSVVAPEYGTEEFARDQYRIPREEVTRESVAHPYKKE